jgi:hypothetical protein
MHSEAKEEWSWARVKGFTRAGGFKFCPFPGFNSRFKVKSNSTRAKNLEHKNNAESMKWTNNYKRLN